MDITILFFSYLKSELGVNRTTLMVEHSMTCRDLIYLLVKKYPKLEPMTSTTQIAVNQEIVRLDYKLKDGDEVALLPPFSGG